jgi:hypothetical protein
MIGKYNEDQLFFQGLRPRTSLITPWEPLFNF